MHTETLGQAIDQNDIAAPSASPAAKKRTRGTGRGSHHPRRSRQDKYFPSVDANRKAEHPNRGKRLQRRRRARRVLGNIAKEGCIVKTAGVLSALVFEGRARVFE